MYKNKALTIHHICNKTQIRLLQLKRSSPVQGFILEAAMLPADPSLLSALWQGGRSPLKLRGALLLLSTLIPFALSLFSQLPCVFWLPQLLLAPCSPLPHAVGAAGCSGWLGQRVYPWQGATHVPAAELNVTEAKAGIDLRVRVAFSQVCCFS